jgi:hypothetical protein
MTWHYTFAKSAARSNNINELRVTRARNCRRSAKLKKLLAEAMLDASAMRELLSKKW